MKSIDVFGPPGVGKSALCDGLWHPHAINWQDENIKFPKAWLPFLQCTARMLKKVEEHPTYEACLRMTRRSLRKMAAVATDQRDSIYVQTGFAQRGLGFGWRLNEAGLVEEVREYFELMPVSLGAVALSADLDTILGRNRAREDKLETAHENRSHMVPLMERPMEIAIEVLSQRIPILAIDTRMPIEEARRQLLEFRDSMDRSSPTGQRSPFRPDYQEALVSAFLR